MAPKIARVDGDLLDVFLKLDSEGRADVMGFAGVLEACQENDFLSTCRPSGRDWEKTPDVIKQMVLRLIDRYKLSKGAYSNLLSDWSRLKGGDDEK